METRFSSSKRHLIETVVCINSNALEKATNKCCLKIFCTYSFDFSTNGQNVRSCRSIFSKTVLVFSKKFINFGSDTSKKGILNLSCLGSKGYKAEVLVDSEVNFLQEKEKDAAFRLFGKKTNIVLQPNW